MQCTDANSFTITPGVGGSATWAMAKIGSNCAEDYIGIEGNELYELKFMNNFLKMIFFLKLLLKVVLEILIQYTVEVF